MAQKTNKKKGQRLRTGVHRRLFYATSPTARPSKEDFFAKAFRLSPHPIGITELDTGRCLEINDACLQIFGFDRQEVIGETTLMLGIWPDPHERARLIQQLTSEGSIRDHEVSMRVKGGGLRRFLISIDLIRLNRKQCLLTIGTDITERKRAEEQLRGNHRFISEMTAVLPGMLYIFDLTEQRNVYVNRHTGVALGYSTEEVHALGADFIPTVLHPDDVSRMREHFEMLKQQPDGVTTSVEYRFRHRNGTYRWFISRDVVWQRSAEGHVCQILGMATDITERKQAEEALNRLNDTLEQRISERTLALRESEERLRLAQHAARIGTFEWNLQTGTSTWTPQLEALYGLAPGEFGRTQCAWEQLIHPDDRARAVSLMGQAFKTGKPTEGEWRVVWPDGSLHWLAGRWRLINNGGGMPLRMIGINLDITDRKRAEEELRRQQAKLEDLTSKLLTAQERERQRIAHDLHDDFTQRLAALAVDVGSLERLCSSDEALLPRCRSIRESAVQLTDDMHHFAYRLHPSTLEHLGLEAALRDHITEFTQRTGVGVQYVVRNVPTVIRIEQATCLYRVTQESLQNVFKHAGASRVMVRMSGTSRGVGVCISDNGRGFLRESMGLPGRGLGLVSMEERVRLLKGTFRLRTRLGEGTEVHAWVPAGEASDRMN